MYESLIPKEQAIILVHTGNGGKEINSSASGLYNETLFEHMNFENLLENTYFQLFIIIIA